MQSLFVSSLTTWTSSMLLLRLWTFHENWKRISPKWPLSATRPQEHSTCEPFCISSYGRSHWDPRCSGGFESPRSHHRAEPSPGYVGCKGIRDLKVKLCYEHLICSDRSALCAGLFVHSSKDTFLLVTFACKLYLMPSMRILSYCPLL